jgi:hypothetical protein
MGDVYRARDSRLNRDVALKVLSAHLASDPGALARFEREAQAVAVLSHPNILAIHDYGTADGVVFTVTELLEGETLRARLSSGALPPRKAIEYGVQIVRGIAAAHERGIIHRDIKPENIFLTRDGAVKLLDFGLAKTTTVAAPNPQAETQLNADTTPGTVLGTVGYMSPEQVRGLALDHRTDIFSFGAVLYEMLAGKRPFRGDSHVETMNAILKEDPPEFSTSNAALPAALDRIVRRCLEKQPADRFHSAHDLAIALEAVASGSNVGSGAGAVPPPHLLATSRPRVGLLAAAGVAIAVGVAAFFAGRFTTSAPAATVPDFHRLTFRDGRVLSALFAPGGDSVLYSAIFEGEPALQIFTTSTASPDSLLLAFQAAQVVAVSSKGELAIVSNRRPIRAYAKVGTLARAQMSGGSSREVMEDVQDAAWLPDGSNLVVARFSNGRYQLEFPIGHVVYETTGWISHPRVSPDGKRVAFLDHPILGDDRGSAAVVDSDGRKATISPTYDSTVGLSWAPSGREVWFAGAAGGGTRSIEASTLDGRTRTVLATPSNLTLGDIAEDGRVLLVDDNDRRGISGLAPGETKERDLSALDWSLPQGLSADGKVALISEAGDGGGPGYSVFLRQTNGAPSVRLGPGSAVALSPDAKWVIAAVLDPAPAQFVLMPTGAGQTRPLTHDTITHLIAQFLPDGKNFLFTGFEPGKRRRTWLQLLAGGAARPVTPEGVSGAVASPDGSAVAAFDTDGRLKLFPFDGGAPRPLKVDAPDTLIAFSTDGNPIATRPIPGGSIEIAKIDAKTGARKILHTITPRSDGVSPTVIVTPDGRGYIYSYGVTQSTIFLARGLK